MFEKALPIPAPHTMPTLLKAATEMEGATCSYVLTAWENCMPLLPALVVPAAAGIPAGSPQVSAAEEKPEEATPVRSRTERGPRARHVQERW